MPNILQAKRRNVQFTVEVEHHPDESGSPSMWVATCDALGLITESETYEGLTERVWLIAPELAEFNQPGVDVASMRLQFSHIENAADHQIAL